MEHYFDQRWDEAEASFRDLLGRHERHLYEVYLERIAHLRQQPPGDQWDGAFTFTTK